MIFNFNEKRYYFLAAIFLLAAPFAAIAISSTNYIIDPSGADASRGQTNSTSFSLESAIEIIAGNSTATSYKLESGSSFAGYCGDGFIDPTEDCEGSNLNSQTCVTQGFASGTLSCSALCVFNTSGCISSPAPGHDPSVINPPAAPTFDTTIQNKIFTYTSEILIFGTKSVGASVAVNGSSEGVIYATDSRWQKYQALALGLNAIAIKSSGANGDSAEVSVTVKRRKIGDANDDGSVNDYDFSLFANHWHQAWQASDFNEDGQTDDYDLSLMGAYWGK